MNSRTDQTAPRNESGELLPDQRDSGVVAETGALVPDPGLPPHEPRRQDIDERAAQRSERTVAFLFTLAILATVGFVAAYVAIPIDRIVFIFPFGHISGLNFALGLTLAVALFCVGAGAIHWARTLMSDEEFAENRHPIEATAEVREEVFEEYQQSAVESTMGRRKLARNTMLGALAVVPLTGLVLLRDMGPLPEDKLRHTAWRKGSLIINEATLQPLRPEDITVGSLTQAMPEGLDPHAENFHTEIAKAAVMLVRLEPEDIKSPRSAEWGHEGILCYSKICTHIGCPATLYEQQTHHALCPCHQSTFDLADGARVLFGPAGHPLPQLRITVNDEGFLQALGDFEEPPGPSFWERG
ncbi:ubiquinol-cytochrome c reductase iron-sulfur subunit [Streptomyces sp. SBT349]|uniref:cytochrome bc1 complex Rieske iron-sulfur subunit n=1 Tax=Streptomyces sp. SBT349 TaxID=1580539 RepID=UPI00099D1008|nr:Rieske 2Fe-2S domain-containing protein [Streptomyces sp. SBT349]